MTDEFGEIKVRFRALDQLLAKEGASGDTNRTDFAQAVSRARRILRRGHRSNAPTVELRTSIERAEALSKLIR